VAAAARRKVALVWWWKFNRAFTVATRAVKGSLMFWLSIPPHKPAALNAEKPAFHKPPLC